MELQMANMIKEKKKRMKSNENNIMLAIASVTNSF